MTGMRGALIGMVLAYAPRFERDGETFVHSGDVLPLREAFRALRLPECFTLGDTNTLVGVECIGILDSSQLRPPPIVPPQKRFVPPSREEVAAYMLERYRDASEADAFHDFHTSKGWVVGRVSMKDWRAAVRTWMGRGHTEPKSESRYDIRP